MDWKRAVGRNSEALRDIVASLFSILAAAGGSGDASAATFMLPRRVCAAILLVLLPAESALRRLIIIAAHGLALKPGTPRLPPANLSALPADGASKTPAFCLFDSLKAFPPDAFDNSALPHAGFHSGGEAAFHTPNLLPPDEPLDATQLVSRLRALRSALGDLPRQARRFVRWQARRDAKLKANRPTRVTPFRPGLPPGWRARRIHAVDDVLHECHGLAGDLLNGPDTG